VCRRLQRGTPCRCSSCMGAALQIRMREAREARCSCASGATVSEMTCRDRLSCDRRLSLLRAVKDASLVPLRVAWLSDAFLADMSEGAWSADRAVDRPLLVDDSTSSTWINPTERRLKCGAGVDATAVGVGSPSTLPEPATTPSWLRIVSGPGSEGCAADGSASAASDRTVAMKDGAGNRTAEGKLHEGKLRATPGGGCLTECRAPDGGCLTECRAPPARERRPIVSPLPLAS
jgi:hypothetical protein